MRFRSKQFEELHTPNTTNLGVERVSVIVRNIKFDVINVIAEALSVSTASVTSVAKAIDVVRAADVAGSHALEIAYCAKGENNTPRLSLHLFVRTAPSL